jgi:hypothetical protein
MRWCNPISYTVGAEPIGVALGDWDGDRWNDIAVAVQGSDKISILMNTGLDAAISPPLDVPMAIGSAPHSVVAVDIDNDSDLDLVVTRAGMNDVQVLTNNGGVFSLGGTTAVGGTLPSDVSVGDLDGNGFQDVVTSNRSSASVSVMLNSAGVLAVGVPYSVGSEPRGLALSDLDGEGTLDLAVASVDTGAVDILLNDGGGVLAFESSLSVGSGLSPNGDVAVGDFDSNEHIDIAVVTSGSAGDFATIFLNSGSASFGSPAHFDSDVLYATRESGDPSGLVAGDFDINGTVDLALTNLNSGAVANLVGDGAGSFSKPFTVLGGEVPVAIAAGELDANGSDDLVITNRDAGTVGVVINTFVLFADGFEWGDTWPWSSQEP